MHGNAHNNNYSQKYWSRPDVIDVYGETNNNVYYYSSACSATYFDQKLASRVQTTHHCV